MAGRFLKIFRKRKLIVPQSGRMCKNCRLYQALAVAEIRARYTRAVTLAEPNVSLLLPK